MFNVNLETNRNNIIIDEELNEFLNSLKIDYTAFYRGIVIENRDPEYKGRIKVRVPQIYGVDTSTQYYVPNEMIPWANCAIASAGNDSGTFLPPNIGDTVFVTFENGDDDKPMYFGGLYTIRSEDLGEKGIGSTGIYNDSILKSSIDDLPGEVINGTERIIYKSLKGAVIMIDDKDEEESIRITDQSGQSIIMENLSEKTLKRRGTDTGNNPKSQIVLTNSYGDSITLAQGKIHLKSPNIIFETDNFEQVGLTEYTDEINLADIILGSEKTFIDFRVVDIRTGNILDEAAVTIYKVLPDGTKQHITTNYYPIFTQELKEGNYYIEAEAYGYYLGTQELEVIEGINKQCTILMSRETNENTIQIVLTWNNAISDMDSHTKIFNQAGNLLGHVSYSNKNYTQDDIEVVNLDVDDTDYYGPETTTINKTFDNKYLFYIHRFTGYGLINTSECNIKVFDKGELKADITMPSTLPEESEDYEFWKVLTYEPKTENIQIINEYTTEEPGGYS